MASGQTQYYGLSQWEAVDKVERVDFNSDNAKIDGALRALAEQAGRKSRQIYGDQPVLRSEPEGGRDRPDSGGEACLRSGERQGGAGSS